jgi:hypothetical protein
MSGGDRMIHHGYASDYASHLARFLDKEDDLVIVECGILKGTGLAVWSKLFPNALLIGLDIDLEHTKRNLDALKARGAFEVTDPVLLEFDQFKPNTESLLRVLNGRKVNIVIDDGFHSNETIVNTYEALREHLAEGFVYFAEDNSEVYKKLKERHNDVSIYSYGELTVIERPKPEPPTAKSLDISTIHKAARGGNIEAVKKYLADGTEVDVKDEDGGTPLYYATGRGHKEIAELLIANDADVNAKTNDGDTPLDYANDEIADLLRKHGGKRGVELKAEGK